MQPTTPHDNTATAPAVHDGDAAVRTSTTGAVLGQPGREYGAYGMVLDPVPDEATPSVDERSVRGLGPDAGRPAEEYLLDPRDAPVPSLPTETALPPQPV